MIYSNRFCKSKHFCLIFFSVLEYLLKRLYLDDRTTISNRHHNKFKRFKKFKLENISLKPLMLSSDDKQTFSVSQPPIIKSETLHRK